MNWNTAATPREPPVDDGCASEIRQLVRDNGKEQESREGTRKDE